MADDEPFSDARDAVISRQLDQLLPDEMLGDRLVDVAYPQRVVDSEINAKYERGEIRVVTEQARYPLDSISGLLESGNYLLDPDYQRRHRWTTQQRSRLIESFIMNVPVPPIFLYEYDYNKYEVMDGLQRLTAVRDFYLGSFKLEGLEYWSELEGRTYERLPSRIRDGINRRYISSIVLLKETSHGEDDPERLKRFVFGRINTGGVQLSDQELRNALYDGPMNRLCKELASSPVLRRLWNIPVNIEDVVAKGSEPAENDQPVLDLFLEGMEVPDNYVPEAWRDMTDVELVLRFFANRQRLLARRENLRGYLDSYLQAANHFPDQLLGQLADVFLRTLELAEAIFGSQAFRRVRHNQWTHVPNVSIYDGLMNVLSRMLVRGSELIERRDEIVAGMPDLYEQHSRVFNLRGQTRLDLIRREAVLDDYLSAFLPS